MFLDIFLDLIAIIFFIFGLIVLRLNFIIKERAEKSIQRNNDICLKYKKEIDDTFNQNNQFVITFKDYQKNQYFKMGLVLLKLKQFHEQILNDLDPYTDYEFFHDVKYNIDQIDIYLKEISLLTPSIIDNINTDFSIFDKTLKDNITSFFKN